MDGGQRLRVFPPFIPLPIIIIMTIILNPILRHSHTFCLNTLLIIVDICSASLSLTFLGLGLPPRDEALELANDAGDASRRLRSSLRDSEELLLELTVSLRLRRRRVGGGGAWVDGRGWVWV